MDALSMCKMSIRNDIADSTFKNGFIHESAGQDVIDKFDAQTINEALSDGYAFADIPRDTMTDYIERMQNNAESKAVYEGIEVPKFNMPPKSENAVSDTFLGIYLSNDEPQGEMYYAKKPVSIDAHNDRKFSEDMRQHNNTPPEFRRIKNDPDKYYTAGPLKRAQDSKTAPSFTRAEGWTPTAEPVTKQTKTHRVRTLEEVYIGDGLSNRDRKLDAQKQYTKPIDDEFGRYDGNRSKSNHRDKKRSPRRGGNSRKNETAFEVNRPKSKNHVKSYDISGPSR